MQIARVRLLRLCVLAGLPILSTMAGCSALGLKQPTAQVTGVSLKDIDLEGLTMQFDVELDNPYAVALPLVNLDYGLTSAGKSFLSGKADAQGAVPAGGKKTIALPAQVKFKDLLAILTGVKLGAVVPYQADLGVSVDTPLLGTMRLPMRTEGQLPVPAPPEVRVQEIKWDAVTLDSAGGTVKLRVVNRNQFAVDLGRLAYGLTLGKTEVANTAIARAVSFPADGGAGEVDIPIHLSPKSLGLAVLGLLTGDGASYRFTGTMDVKTPFGPMSLPVDASGNTVFRKK